MAKKKQKLSMLLNNKSLSSTNIEPEKGGGYRVINFYFDKTGIRRRASFLVEEIVEDIELKDNTRLLGNMNYATKYLTFSGEKGYYINFYKR